MAMLAQGSELGALVQSEKPLEELLDPGPERPCLKVAFIGTHGVGKTTLCFELAARLKRLDRRVDMVKEVARSCRLPLNRDTTVEAQAWILHTQISREIEAGQGQDVIVCDRSVLDNYAYMVSKFGRLQPYDLMVSRWLDTYALLAWAPILEDPRFDGVRDTDRRYQRRIEETIGELVETFRAVPLALDPEDREGWIDEVIERLSLRSPQLPLFGESP
jgi:nicotinamide riboside kinase